MPGKAVIQKQRKDTDFPEQTKAEEIHYHQTRFTRNAKESSLSGSKRMLINIIKTHWVISLTMVNI